MVEVERFSPEGEGGCNKLQRAEMLPDVEGQWVRFSDFQALGKRLIEIEAKMPQWILVSERLPVRRKGALGVMEFYCKTSCGIESLCYHDFDSDGPLEPHVRNFDDPTLTAWLSIPGVTLDENAGN